MKLYRFEKLEEDRCRTIADKKLWISSPTKFNDLNDCRIPAIYMPPFTQEYFDKLQKMIKISYPVNFNYENSILSKKVIDDLNNYIIDAQNSDFSAGLRMEYYVNSIRQEIINSTGVCCFFSGDINEPLLWAHYADSHKGFCIEYEYNEDECSNIHPVNYQSAPRIPSARELVLCPEETLSRILTSKTMHWQYEKEYRFIELFSLGENELGRSIDLPHCLKPLKVIMGAKMQDEKNLLKKINLPIEKIFSLIE